LNGRAKLRERKNLRLMESAVRQNNTT
jgi:hypothetical protein